MRKLAVFGLALAALLIAAPPSHAELRPVLSADIPHEFWASGNKFPAGHYQIAWDDDNYGVLELRNLDTGKAKLITFLTSAGPSSEDALVFDEQGNQRYLSEIHLEHQDGFSLAGASGRHTHTQVKAQKAPKAAPKK